MNSFPPNASPEAATACPACGAAASGRFCANCGAPQEGATCSVCKGELSAGSKFCHHCGSPAAAAQAAAPAKSSPLPWVVAALALLTMFAMLAGRGFNNARGSTLDAPNNALPQAGLDDRGAPQPDQGAATRAPDISSMSPQERTDRLFNKIMLLNSQGKTDSVQFFAPMALQSYQMLPSMTADQRYDMGRVAEIAGAIPLAKAQADSILKKDPSHLLGLILAARVASLTGDKTGLLALEKRLVAAEKPELAKKRDEYDRHQDDIANGLAQARGDLGMAR